MPGLPVSALMVVCPVTAAVILSYRQHGIQGVSRLRKRSADVHRLGSLLWLIPAALLKPGLFAISYAVMLWMGVSLPTHQLGGAALLALVFFLSALAEELGWMGYAVGQMERRIQALGAGIVLGLIWAGWHIIPFLQADRSLSWIGWQCLYLVSSRILIVWIFNNTGRSVFVAALFHASGNLSWQLFPVQRSAYDPRITGSIATLVAILVIATWGPRTLTGRKESTVLAQHSQ
ncbi:CPBP family intramembrane metalloprotease [Candidatus Bipolaricaulota bacterium]|nr:CPBP family intramembrane metalloprotease [Candidatus Bipolaricaulota bacterium]